MAEIGIDHPLFECIRQEHQIISLQIQKLESEGDSDSVILWLLENAENKHHYKEEVLLFDPLSKKDRISEGGPQCTMFFDFHLMEPPVAAVEKIINKKIQIEDHQKEFYQKNSPVCIPVDEHRAGKALLTFLLENKDQLSPEGYSRCIDLYSKIQKLHINKEESCFFHLCCSLLSKSEADQICQDWQKINLSISLDDNIS